VNNEPLREQWRYDDGLYQVGVLPNKFQDRRFQPLTHSSVSNSSALCRNYLFFEQMGEAHARRFPLLRPERIFCGEQRNANDADDL
jgi:hypothetical protein